MHKPKRRDARTTQPGNAVCRHRERKPPAAISNNIMSRIVDRGRRPLLRPGSMLSIPLGAPIADVTSREFFV
jgi:hypothetical protein